MMAVADAFNCYENPVYISYADAFMCCCSSLRDTKLKYVLEDTEPKYMRFAELYQILQMAEPNSTSYCNENMKCPMCMDNISEK